LPRSHLIFINFIKELSARGRVDTVLQQSYLHPVMVQCTNYPCCQPELYNARDEF